MSAYILSLCVAAIAAAVVELLAPRGDGGRLAGSIRMIAGLFLLVALLRPLTDGISYLSAVADGDIADILPDDLPTPAENYEATLYAALSDCTAAELEAWVTSTLTTEFAIPREHITVSALCEPATPDSPLSLDELRIGLSGSSALRDPHPIEDYFEKALSVPCYLTISP